jgi:hypothetical protein
MTRAAVLVAGSPRCAGRRDGRRVCRLLDLLAEAPPATSHCCCRGGDGPRSTPLRCNSAMAPCLTQRPPIQVRRPVRHPPLSASARVESLSWCFLPPVPLGHMLRSCPQSQAAGLARCRRCTLTLPVAGCRVLNKSTRTETEKKKTVDERSAASEFVRAAGGAQVRLDRGPHPMLCARRCMRCLPAAMPRSRRSLVRSPSAAPRREGSQAAVELACQTTPRTPPATPGISHTPLAAVSTGAARCKCMAELHAGPAVGGGAGRGAPATCACSNRQPPAGRSGEPGPLSSASSSSSAGRQAG